MYDVVALGELLIDFIQNEKNEQGRPLFEANPGGAPCNVLAMLQKMGYQTAFIGKVGADAFGKQLADAISGLGIDASGLRYEATVPTTLAFVHRTPDGDREFSFYRNPGADLMLSEREIAYELIQQSKIFHFGSLSMTAEPARSATKAAVSYAKQEKKWISFDPNLREALWESLEEAKEAVWYGIEQCDILKIADNELVWLTGESDYDAGIKKIKERSQVKLLTLTLGKKGSIVYYADKKAEAEAFVNPCTIDTTGAGDTFCGCLLGSVLEHGLENLSESVLKQMLRRANAAASIVTTRKGALGSMPEAEEIKAVLGE